MFRRLENNKKEIKDFLLRIKSEGKSVFGYGASTKGNVLGNYFGLSKIDLPYISDINPYKYGRRTPGTRIPIISHQDMRKAPPDYLLVFIWHLRKEVLKDEFEYIKNGGKIVFPLPRLHVVDSENYDIYLNSNLNDQSFDISNTTLTE
jgi:NDP-4-keto-2,6-dideoxyhexose 3-C-methyltransferase